MRTQYIPRGSDLVASAFRRLDEQVAYLRRQVALSSLWAWNYQARLERPRVAVHADPVERKRHRWELILAAVVACLALCACGREAPEARELTRTEIEALFSDRSQFAVDYVWEQPATGKLVIVAWRETK